MPRKEKVIQFDKSYRKDQKDGPMDDGYITPYASDFDDTGSEQEVISLLQFKKESEVHTPDYSSKFVTNQASPSTDDTYKFEP